MDFIHDDGGRAASGYKGLAGDCVARAISIATGIGYDAAYQMVNAATKRATGAKTARTGVPKKVIRQIMKDLGWTWNPTMKIGQGCKTHLKKDELPEGNIIVSLSGHVAAVKNGVLHDTYDSSRDGARCVYGYWSFTACPLRFTEKLTHVWFDGPVLATYEDQNGELWLGAAWGDFAEMVFPVVMVPWASAPASTTVDENYNPIIDAAAIFDSATVAYIVDICQKGIKYLDVFDFLLPFPENDKPIGDAVMVVDQRVKLGVDVSTAYHI